MGKRYNRIKKLVREDRTPYTGTRDFNGGWRKKILSESEWTPVTGSIANSSSQTFVHPTGATTTVSGLGGVETTPSTVTIDAFGDIFDVPAPEYGQYGMQGYAPPLGNEVMKRNAAYQKELEEFRKKQDEQMRNIKSTLKSLGTSWEEMRANGWALIKDDGTAIMITPSGSTADMFNWTDNVEISVGIPDPSVNFKPYKTVGPTTSTNPGGYRHRSVTFHNSILVKTIRLEIGEPPLPPSVNSQLDASQEFTQQVGADELMNARVTDTTKPAPKFIDTELTIDDFYSAADYSAFKAGGGNAAMKEKGQTIQQVIDQGKINLGQYDGGPRNPTPTSSKIANNTSMLPTFDGVPRHNPLPSLTQMPVGFPYSDAIGNTLRYATGNYDPKVPVRGGQSAALELSVLNSIENEIRSGRITKDPNRPGYFTVRGDQQSYEGPGGGSLTNNYLTNASAQGLLRAYSFKPTKNKGIIVRDRFNLTAGRNIGGAAIFSNAANYWLNKFGVNASVPNFEQGIADILVDMGDAKIRRRGGNPKDDPTAGFDLEYTIPWERIPNNHPLRGNVKESTIWSRINKYR